MPGRWLPILALSADAMQHDVERAIEAGCNGHVSKPIVARDLLARIDRLLAEAASATRTPVLGTPAGTRPDAG